MCSMGLGITQHSALFLRGNWRPCQQHLSHLLTLSLLFTHPSILMLWEWGGGHVRGQSQEFTHTHRDGALYPSALPLLFSRAFYLSLAGALSLYIALPLSLPISLSLALSRSRPLLLAPLYVSPFLALSLSLPSPVRSR